ncbi:MAG TPA: regulatory iron-sulfur-containing complex subunit RicT, partial [Chitinophagaceae bacterium]|nr:regulatory iron-sulfur-containing complex subunit RicT [Chitinophagaceae bacterium]
CSTCSTGNNKVLGCKNNGGCSTGSCNRMNVYDWLVNLPFADPESSCKIVEVSFNNGSRKEFFRNTTLQYFEKGDMVAVEGVSGFDVGMVNLTGELVRMQMKKRDVKEDDAEMKKILRRASDRDIESYKQNKTRQAAALAKSRSIALDLKLDMKLIEVEIQADGRKATFFYTAEDRVDFRELIKIYASEFKVKVEMKQIGIRQEAAKVGGIGSCGRELCCSSWLTDFKSVTTTVARYQNLSINQTKLSGQCGRLKCCLNYELDTYLDALQNFPDNADLLQIARGSATLIKKDIFKNLMWYVLPDSNKQYPLTIKRVKEIKALNAKGIKPEELEAVEVISGKPKEIEPEFVDVVGQISLRSLERSSKKKQIRETHRDDKKENRNQQRQDTRGHNRPDSREQQKRDSRGNDGAGNRNQGRQENKPPRTNNSGDRK